MYEHLESLYSRARLEGPQFCPLKIDHLGGADLISGL